MGNLVNATLQVGDLVRVRSASSKRYELSDHPNLIGQVGHIERMYSCRWLGEVNALATESAGFMLDEREFPLEPEHDTMLVQVVIPREDNIEPHMTWFDITDIEPA